MGLDDWFPGEMQFMSSSWSAGDGNYFIEAVALNKLREWIAAEREFLAWRTGLEAARRAWQATPDSSKSEALLMGVALTQAQSWLAKRREDLSGIDQDFIDQGTRRERKAKARAQLIIARRRGSPRSWARISEKRRRSRSPERA